MTMVERAEGEGRRITAAYLAHFVIRSKHYRESIDWYERVFNATPVFSNEMVTFLTFDDEHHRIAIGNVPALNPHDPKGAGIDHIAFSYATIGDLIQTYDRLRDAGIRPYWAINHGPTTSLYFHDPDGVQIELQTDNISFAGGPTAFFSSEDFGLNPIGLEFDPDELSARYHRGEDAMNLLERGKGAPAKIPAS